MNEAPEPQQERTGAVAKPEPHIVSLERVGWRIMHKAPGKPPAETGAHAEKTEALKMAALAAQKLADLTQKTVELHTQDAKGRDTGKRHFDPTSAEKEAAEKEVKKGD